MDPDSIQAPPQVQVIQAPEFDEIVKHVKSKNKALDMQEWAIEQRQEQFQDEAK